MHSAEFNYRKLVKPFDMVMDYRLKIILAKMKDYREWNFELYQEGKHYFRTIEGVTTKGLPIKLGIVKMKTIKIKVEPKREVYTDPYGDEYIL
jgi:hypothetical protein